LSLPLFLHSCSCEQEAEKLAVQTLKQVMEEKINATNVDIASVKPTFRLYPTEEVEEIIKTLE